jgi:hypothetical protein
MINDMESKTNSGSNFPLAGILTVIFVCCKLFGVIDWSWWWVVSPLWIGLIAQVCLAAVVAVVYIILHFLADR